MAQIFYSLSIAFDWLMAPMVAIHPWLGMMGISLLTAILVLFVYKYTSNQPAIRKAKNLIKAHLMAMSLYKDSLRVITSSAIYILGINLKYISLNLVPLLFMIVPVSILMANLDGWFGYQALRPGERALVTLHLGDGEVMGDDIHLHCPDGVSIDAPEVRIPSASEIYWRVVAEKPGTHYLTVALGDQMVSKRVHVGEVSDRLTVKRHDGALLESLFYPSKPIDEAAGVVSLRLSYAPAEMSFFDWKLHWIYVYLVLTLVLALAFKGLFKVTF